MGPICCPETSARITTTGCIIAKNGSSSQGPTTLTHMEHLFAYFRLPFNYMKARSWDSRRSSQIYGDVNEWMKTKFLKTFLFANDTPPFTTHVPRSVTDIPLHLHYCLCVRVINRNINKHADEHLLNNFRAVSSDIRADIPDEKSYN